MTAFCCLNNWINTRNSSAINNGA